MLCKNSPPRSRYEDVQPWLGTLRSHKIAPQLDGVCKTMLWTLYDRACEAACSGGVLRDPDCVRLCNALDYDFEGHFGTPTGVFAARAVEFDKLLRRWLEQHPDGLVVSLGEGLETQAYRVDNGRMHWLTVDLPPAIKLREQLLPPCHRFRNFADSISDARWIDDIESGGDVLIVAQGLLMYLEADAVGRFLTRLATRVCGANMVFDVIPRWFSELTRWGIMQTPYFQLPLMPWGIDCDEIEAWLSSWSPKITYMAVHEYRAPHGWVKLAEDLFRLNPFAQRFLPAIVQLTFSDVVKKTRPSPQKPSTSTFRLAASQKTPKPEHDAGHAGTLPPAV